MGASEKFPRRALVQPWLRPRAWDGRPPPSGPALPIHWTALVCGGTRSVEPHSREDTKTCLPTDSRGNRHRLLVPPNTRDFLAVTGRKSFKREEDELGLGPVKQSAQSRKRGGHRMEAAPHLNPLELRQLVTLQSGPDLSGTPGTEPALLPPARGLHLAALCECVWVRVPMCMHASVQCVCTQGV